MFNIEGYCLKAPGVKGAYNNNDPYLQNCLRNEDTARKYLISRIPHVPPEIVAYCTQKADLQQSYGVMRTCIQDPASLELSEQEAEESFAQEAIRQDYKQGKTPIFFSCPKSIRKLQKLVRIITG